MNSGQNLIQRAHSLYRERKFLECLALLDPESANFAENPAYFKLKGLALGELNEDNDALKCFVESIKLDPLDPLPYVNIGNLHAKNLEFEEADKYFKLALDIEPNYMEAVVGLGVSAFQRLDYEACETHFKRALQFKPDHVIVMTNLGNVYSVQGRYQEALTLLNKAIAREKDNSLARTNRALIKLGQGKFESAWEDYEYRWDSGNFMAKRFQELPRWTGPGRRKQNVLIHAEQGIGDEIMFASLFNDLRGLSERFFIECDPRLFNIFRASFEHLEFVPKGLIRDISPIQSQIPLASLGGIFRTSKKLFPREAGGFLRITEKPLSSDTLSALESLPRPWTGVSWESYALTSNFRGRKSITAEEFSILTKRLPGTLINLQFPNPHKHEKHATQEIPENVVTLPNLDLKNDIEKLATLLKRLDNVITIGNSVAHLCGALGVKADVLLPSVPDWRWEHSGSQSIWYQSLELIRNKSSYTWKEPLEGLISKRLQQPG